MSEPERPPQNRHERDDIPARWPVIMGAATLLLLPVSIAIVSALMSTVWSETKPSPEPFPDERRVIERASEGPTLRTDPPAGMAELAAEWQVRLSGYGWVDREEGIVHIPIKQAMQRLAEAGLSGPTRWPGPMRDPISGPVREPSPEPETR